MNRRLHNLPVLLAAVVSILLHVSVLLPFLGWSMKRPEPGAAKLISELSAEPPTPAPETPQEELTLGIEESTESSMTWIGYDEYQEHLAQLSEVDQAAFAPDATMGRPDPPPLDGSPLAEPVETAEMERVEEAIEVINPPPPAVEVAAEEPGTPETPPTLAIPDEATLAQDAPTPETDDQRLEELVTVALEEAAVLVEEQPEDVPVMEDAPPIEEPVENPADDPEQSDETTTTSEQDPTDPAEVVTPTRPGQDAKPTDAPPATGESGDESQDEGDPSDKESQATSIVDVPLVNWRAGKPLASQGLELLPKKPKFLPLMHVRTAPMNPLCELIFGADGKVRRASIRRSSGYRDVDQVILTSLYGWRARGKGIDELGEKRTLPIKIRIVLVPGRDS